MIFLPNAVRSISSKMRSLISPIIAMPSITWPQSTSFSCLTYNAVFVPSFNDGDGAQPQA